MAACDLKHKWARAAGSKPGFQGSLTPGRMVLSDAWFDWIIRRLNDEDVPRPGPDPEFVPCPDPSCPHRSEPIAAISDVEIADAVLGHAEFLAGKPAVDESRSMIAFRAKIVGDEILLRVTRFRTHLADLSGESESVKEDLISLEKLARALMRANP